MTAATPGVVLATDGRRLRVPASALRGSLGLLGFIVLLELVPRIGIVDPAYLPPFNDMVGALRQQLATPDFWDALAATLRGWALGLFIAVAAGCAVGMAIGTSATLRAVTATTIEFLRPIPSVALIPVVVLLYGTSMVSTLLLVMYASFWQVLVQVIYGVQDVDPVADETARSFRFRQIGRVRHVIWPTTLPYAVTGFRLAAAVALILEVTGELVIGSPGLGRRIALAQSAGAVDTMYALILVTGLIGVTVNVAARQVERRALHWHPSVRGAAS